MFLTGHIMLAYILYKVFRMHANLWLFLFCSILPDASWPFYKNHRKESWYHTPLTFIWSILFFPYWIAILSHFIADIIFGEIRLTPWSKKFYGIIVNKKSVRISTKEFLPIRIIKHLWYNTKWYYVVTELVLLIICVYLLIIV